MLFNAIHTFGFSQVPHFANLSAFGMKLLAAFRRSFFSLLRDNAGSVLSTSSTARFPTVCLLLHVSWLGFTADGLMHNSTNQIYTNTQHWTYSLVHSETWTVLTLKDSPGTNLNNFLPWPQKPGPVLYHCASGNCNNGAVLSELTLANSSFEKFAKKIWIPYHSPTYPSLIFLQ